MVVVVMIVTDGGGCDDISYIWCWFLFEARERDAHYVHLVYSGSISYSGLALHL